MFPPEDESRNERQLAAELERLRAEVSLLRRRTEDVRHEAEQLAAQEYEQLLHRLTQLAESLGTARDHITIFRDLRDFAIASVPCIGIFISLYDAERNVRLARYAWGDDEEVDVSQLPPMPVSAEGPNSRAVRTGQIIITNDYWAMKQAGKGQLGVLVGPDNGLRPQSSLVVPMSTMGRIIGTIEVQSYENNAYREEHLTAMRMAANLAAVALENMRLFEHESHARALAEESNRLKDEFLATLSHELRTPLTAVLGWVSMLRSNRLDDAMRQSAVEIIERNARAQQQIIDDILDVSRIITGKLRFEVQACDIRPVVHAALDIVQPTAAAKNLRFVTSIDPLAGPVMGDVGRLQQVVWNLLSNAVKFTPPDGEVSVSVERAGTHLRIVVADNGVGIRPSFLPYVFDRFRQADQSPTRAFGGLGLGLAIVRHIVELHGGTIRAESPGEGRGATFVVELPLLVTVASEASPDVAAGQARDEFSENARAREVVRKLGGLRLLVVDDEADTLDLLKLLFEQNGADVATASSAFEAMQEFQRRMPDVLICDIGMPVEDGYTFMRRLRARGPASGGAIPAIALTAYAGESDRKRALDSGFQLHVPKPIDTTNLINLIVNLAGTKCAAP